MSRRLNYLATLSMGVFCWTAAGSADLGIAQQSGPVREGLRRTGEAVAEGGRRAAEGTQRVVQGAAEATGQAARRAGEGVARAGQALTGDRNARWRMRRSNDQWWYYSPEGNWMYRQDDQWSTYQPNQDANLQPPEIEPTQMRAQYEQRQSDSYASQDQQQSGTAQGDPQAIRHESGYRGTTNTAGQSSVLYDRCGRPYVCENGRRVYVSLSSTQPEGAPSWSDTESSANFGPPSEQPSPADPSDQYNDSAQYESQSQADRAGVSDQQPGTSQSSDSAANRNATANADADVQAAQQSGQADAAATRSSGSTDLQADGDVQSAPADADARGASPDGSADAGADVGSQTDRN